MAGPLTGLGAQTQIPLSQPYQPGKNDSVREQENRQKDAGAVAKNAYGASQNQSRETPTVVQASSSARADNSDSGQKRGANLDITV